MSNAAQETEAELETFRQQWRDEVTARNKQPQGTLGRAQDEPNGQRGNNVAAAGPSTARRKEAADYSEEIEPKAYHDLPDKEEQLKLGVEGQGHDRNASKEPSSALEHYERAVEKETTGQLGDSMQHYRKAFKVRCLHSSKHQTYMLR